MYFEIIAIITVIVIIITILVLPNNLEYFSQSPHVASVAQIAEQTSHFTHTA